MAEVEPGFESTAPDADASQETEIAEPVEAEAEAGEESEELESEGESSPPVDENDEEKNSFQKRIEKLNTRWRETERALTALEQENLELRKKMTEAPAKVEEVKTLADFEYDDKAYQSYLFTEARKEAARETERILNERDSKSRVESSQVKFAEAEKSFAEQHDDYYEVTRDRGLRISPTMVELAGESDIGAEIIYHLGKNPDIARKIYEMSDAAVGRELTRIESQLRSEKAKPTKSVSKAPPPPPASLGGGEPGRKVSTTDPKSDKLSDEEWFAAEEKRTAKLRG